MRKELFFSIFLIIITFLFFVERGEAVIDCSDYVCGGHACCANHCLKYCEEWEYPSADCGSLSSTCKCKCFDRCANEYCMKTEKKSGYCVGNAPKCGEKPEGPSPGPGITCPGAPCPPGMICIQNPLCAQTFEQLVDSIINFIFTLSLPIVPLMIIIGAFYILTSGGEEKRVATGKNIITYSLIAFAIILFAKGLVAVIKQIIGV